jgi:hypothetical protein
VKLLDITLAESASETLTEEINNKLFDHIMSGVEIISGKHGHFYVNVGGQFCNNNKNGKETET